MLEMVVALLLVGSGTSCAGGGAGGSSGDAGDTGDTGGAGGGGGGAVYRRDLRDADKKREL